MKTEAAEVTHAAQRPAFVGGTNALGRILHNHKSMAAGDVQDGIHLAANAGIMHRNDNLGLVCDGVFDQFLVDVIGVRADIHEDQPGPTHHEGICR